ncbi:hypothetical protein AVO42_02435 [Thiomicrospira sp. XS5]|uniref:hypothetical protein n=1 Tax=Thiomicrospira sp. XS5 TaxID=1775636 RepID=UPI00074802A3|nr:hypothetical protein [Thiomicrospira sp. XS5]KUJ74291.1 hypothetical protein AVO42_02435 [Thiomicrospira sp. XS5]
MKKLLLVLLVVVFAVFAVMFDWFGARDMATNGVEVAKNAVSSLQEAGDTLSHTIEKFDKQIMEKN